MFNIIESYGIQEVITKSILIVYADTKARVLPPGGETELFERFRGVVQVDPLPFTSVVVLSYADDIAIISDSIEKKSRTYKKS